MKYQVYDLGSKEKGSVVVVTLRGSAANVRLMGSSDYQSYRAGRRHRFVGGLAKSSPVRLAIPSSGHWYLTVDMVGLRGSVRSSVAVEPKALPVIRSRPESPLSNIRHELPTSSVLSDETVWDVFISHSAEDKDEVARPLAEALMSRGLTVWVDHLEVKIGDSLRQRIDHGLAHSRFSVVVLSPSFFAKGWPKYELDGIVTRTVAGEQNMLPIWHNIDVDEVRSNSASLADKIALNSSVVSIEEMADQIRDVVSPISVEVA